MYGVSTLAHLTCVSSTHEAVRQKIDQIKEAGIENVMALRGDIPEGMDLSHQETWHYHHAIDLIRELRESDTDFLHRWGVLPRDSPGKYKSKGRHKIS